MTITFRPAVRENASLLIGLVAPSGGGKTYTALKLASGMASGKQFAVIDTEAGRAKHYAEMFTFDHAELKPPFRPDAYLEAIQAADKAGYPVIVVDSMSHEHAGDGGLLDWHDEEVDRMAGDDWKKRERVNVGAWIKPKTSHKKMMQKLLQVRAHLILCFRAEEKVELVKDDKGKLVIVPKKSMSGLDGWVPVTERMVPYELTISLLLLPNAPGFPQYIKVQEQHRSMFPTDKPIDEQSGKLLASWAAGAPQVSTGQTDASSDGYSSPAEDGQTGSVAFIVVEQAFDIDERLRLANIPVDKFCRVSKIKTVSTLPADQYERAIAWIEKVSKAAA